MTAQAPILAIPISVQKHGARGNAGFVLDGSTTSGSHTLTSATANFSVLSPGDVIQVKHGAAAGAVLTTTVSAVVDAHTVTMAAAAGNTLTNDTVLYGRDDTTAFQNWMADCFNSNRTGYAPAGKTYLVSATAINLTQNQKCSFQGLGAKLLPLDGVIAIDVNVGIVGATATGWQEVVGFEVEGANLLSQVGVRCRNSNRYVVKDVRTHQCGTGLLLVNDGVAQPGSVPGYCEDGFFENCHFDGGNVGIDFSVINSGAVSFEENTFVKCNCSGNTIGVRFGVGCSMRNVHMYQVKCWAVGSQTCFQISANMTGFVGFLQAESLIGSGNVATHVTADADITGIQTMTMFLDTIASVAWGTKHIVDAGFTAGWNYHEGDYTMKVGAGDYTWRVRRDGETTDLYRFDGTGWEIGVGNVSNPDCRIERNSNGQWHITRQLIADDSIQLKTKAGTPVDGDYAQTPTNGTIQHDSTRPGGLWQRVAGSWIYCAASHVLTYANPTIVNRFTAEIHKLVVTNNSAFTIQNPTGALDGLQMTIDIKNSSGGAMGTITWDTLYLLAGAFTNPANGKRRTISFYYDGTNWVETNRAAADI